MMNHFDAGFSTDNSSAPGQEGFINNVLNEYFDAYLPRAVRVAAELRARGGAERLVYTTHGWLAHLYVHCPARFVLSGIPLHCPSTTEVAAFKHAVQQGDIVWHAGAFNTEYELAFSAEMVAEQFRLSRELSDELGVPRSRVLSLRDVPGTTRALIPLLARNNITALTVGVNNGSPDPGESTALSSLPLIFSYTNLKSPCALQRCPAPGDGWTATPTRVSCSCRRGLALATPREKRTTAVSAAVSASPLQSWRMRCAGRSDRTTRGPQTAPLRWPRISRWRAPHSRAPLWRPRHTTALCASLALAPLPLIFSCKSETSLCANRRSSSRR